VEAERVAHEERHAALEYEPPGANAEDIHRRAGTRPATAEATAGFHDHRGRLETDSEGPVDAIER
jgi:hypothetical protein